MRAAAIKPGMIVNMIDINCDFCDVTILSVDARVKVPASNGPHICSECSFLILLGLAEDDDND